MYIINILNFFKNMLNNHNNSMNNNLITLFEFKLNFNISLY